METVEKRMQSLGISKLIRLTRRKHCAWRLRTKVLDEEVFNAPQYLKIFGCRTSYSEIFSVICYKIVGKHNIKK